MKLTDDQIKLLRRLLGGSFESEPTADLMALLMLRLVVRGGYTWIITEKGEAALRELG